MKKTYLKQLFTALLLLCSIVATAKDFEAGGIAYNITDATNLTVEVTYTGPRPNILNRYSGAVTIPASVTYNETTYSVTTIGSDAFARCTKLTSITIPNSVISIGERAFSGCGLTSITIPNSVTTIGSAAFMYCTVLTNITIPNSVTSIGGRAFENCTGLTSITIPSSVTSIRYSAFSGCTGLTNITIPNGVTSIEESAFRGCSSLTSIEIPNGVTSIEGYAFEDCTGLTSITIPSSVTSIGYRAFSGCTGLTSIEIPNGVTSIEESAFYGCSSLNAVHISDLAAWCKIDFEDYPFFYAKNLYLNGELVTELVIPNGVTEIKNYAFAYYTGLTSVTIPNGVTSIEESAFDGCTGLTNITIPNSVTSIGGSAFSGCTGLTNITIPNSVTSIGRNAFVGCTGLTNITIPNGVTSIGGKAFSGCTGLTNITIPNSVTSIGGNAFDGCTALRELRIEDGDSTLSLSYNSIGKGLFYDCPLETLYLGRNLSYNTSYQCGFSPFYKVATLKNVTIGNSVTIIKEYIFHSCSGITSIEIPGSVTTIGEYAFQYNDLHEVHIPAGVTSIGYYAFTWNVNLQKITMDSDNEVYNIPDNNNIIMKGDSVIFGWQGAVIPEYAICIDNGAFNSIKGITSITIPAGVTQIGEWAFEACSDLAGIYCLSATPATAYSTTFRGLYEAVTLYVPIGASAAYRTADYWKNFTNIVEMDFTGIEDIEADGDNALHGVKDAYYDLNGRYVSEPAKGVYIRNGKKVYVE
ncbi:MAG: leucine-rich repeat domain-containing protein [Bacteroidaceae bacterium]|nr:leucine-rich repeat domain-containing protein [Bacteroidaceae bacterium]